MNTKYFRQLEGVFDVLLAVFSTIFGALVVISHVKAYISRLNNFNAW